MTTLSSPSRLNQIGRAFLVYLGGAWVMVEASGFLIERYDLDHGLLDLIIIIIVCLIPSVFVFSWFEKRFSLITIPIYVVNAVLIVFALRFFLLNPLAFQPDNLRLIKLSGRNVAVPKLNSIAILPFSNYTGDANQEYLIAGMHDGLISEIGQLGRFHVISRTSTLPYANGEKTISSIAQELNVRSVMESSLSRIGDSVMLRLKLFKTIPEEEMIWSETFATGLGEVPNLYKQVTKSVALQLVDKLNPREVEILSERKEYDPDAFEAYLRGNELTGHLTREAFQKAEEQFLLAIKIDSTIAPKAYGGLSIMWISMRQMGIVNAIDGAKKVDYYFEKQIAADPESRIGEPAILTWQRYKWEAAEKSFTTELEKYPNSSALYAAHAHYLMIMGQMDEAWKQMDLAMNLDPFNPWVIAFSSVLYFHDGKVLTAQKKAELLSELVPDHPMSIVAKWAIYGALGDKNNAVNQLKKICRINIRVNLDDFIEETYQQNDYKMTVKLVADKLAKISESTYIQPNQIALLYRSVDDLDNMFYWMEEMYRVRSGALPYMAIRHEEDDAQKDPRYIAIMQRIGLWE